MPSSVLYTRLLLVALSPAGAIVVLHGPESTKRASKPASGGHRLLVDLEDAPLFDDGSDLWSCDPFQPHRAPLVHGTRSSSVYACVSALDRPSVRSLEYSGSPMGSIVFALVGEGGTELSVATVYASLGLPSDSLEESHANLLPSPCSWELFDISTAVAHRRYAKGCIGGAALVFRWRARGEARVSRCGCPSIGRV